MKNPRQEIAALKRKLHGARGAVAFTGHMMDKAGRVPPRFVPRFRKEDEDAVIRAIRDALERLNARIGFCSAACGGDIIFIEEMLKRGGEVHVVLPYEEELFIRDCVQAPAGAPPEEHFQENARGGWLPRFRRIRKKLASVTILGKKRAHDSAMASDCCNRVFLGLGLLKAESLSTQLTLLALWDGWSGDAPGGTRSMVKLADGLNVRIEYLPHLVPRDVKDIIKTATPPPGIGAQPYRPTLSTEPPQQICAVLFADVMRFSELDETKLPQKAKRGQENILAIRDRVRQSHGMPRQVRIEYEGATYHVMCRGDRRESIFADDADRERFLATLADAGGRCGWLLHGYVLMGNHYHALLETPEANLVRGMTWLQTTYTTRYNARHRTSGHLFGGRYKAILVDPGEPRYFATLLDYLHLNPVRAGLARPEGPGLLEYRWSSLRGYVVKRERARWLTVERGFAALDRADTTRDRRGMLGDLERRMREEAAERCGLVEVPGHESLQSTLQRGWFFGREAFREWLLEKAGALLERHRTVRQNYHGPEVSDHGKARARAIIEEGLREAGLDRAALAALPKSDPRKVRLARAVRKDCAVPLKWLGEELQLGTAMNVSRLTNFKERELKHAKIFSDPFPPFLLI